MMINIHHQNIDVESYRTNRVRSLFNVSDKADFCISADLPSDNTDWQIGVIVGPSGSGKTSIGRQFWPSVYISDPLKDWPQDKPLIDALAPDDNFDTVTAALHGVGLSSVPAWLRPFNVLSQGEQHRAGLARILLSSNQQVIVDEYTGTLDRTVACNSAVALARAWRKRGGQLLLLTCHSDVLPYLEPDWTFDTSTGYLAGRYLQRPKLQLDIYKTDWRYWRFFEQYHYLKLPPMIAGKCYVACVDGQPIAHLGLSCRNKGKDVEARVGRFVVLPEWQGRGVGISLITAVSRWSFAGSPWGRFPGRPVTTSITTSHPGLSASLRKHAEWRQIAASLYSTTSRGHNLVTMARSNAKHRERGDKNIIVDGGAYGGHMRATQSFRYVGPPIW